MAQVICVRSCIRQSRRLMCANSWNSTLWRCRSPHILAASGNTIVELQTPMLNGTLVHALQRSCTPCLTPIWRAESFARRCQSSSITSAPRMTSMCAPAWAITKRPSTKTKPTNHAKKAHCDQWKLRLAMERRDVAPRVEVSSRVICATAALAEAAPLVTGSANGGSVSITDAPCGAT